MSEHDTEVHRITPTSPEATSAIVELSEDAETFAEPSGTVAEMRREGAEIPEDTPALDDAAARQDRLEQAREKMWETTQHGAGVEGLGVQEEETARIADHLVFPGTGMREMREGVASDPSVLEMGPETGGESPTGSPDSFPPSEWPPKEEGQG
jgi:hypothetical protein